jgi:hypothetical protein
LIGIVRVMRRGVAQYLVGSVVLVLLSGCGLFKWEKRAAWRDEAEQACLAAKAVPVTAYVEPSREIDGPGACGMLQPFKIAAFADGTVGLSSRATLACPIIPEIDRWLLDVVQPAAQIYFGQPVAELRVGSYACRGMNNQAGAQRSEHSYGNAVDVMSFRLADGREVTVERGWRASEADQGFLREVFHGACQIFTTVLAPGSDAFHYNHLHLDLARHNAGRRICKPIIKFASRLGDVPSAMTPRRYGQPAYGSPGESQPAYASDALEELIEADQEPIPARPTAPVRKY